MSGAGGWLAYVDPALPAPVFFRAREEGDRLVVGAVLVEGGDQPVTGALLRQVPVARADAVLAGAFGDLLRLEMNSTTKDPVAALRADIAARGAGSSSPGASPQALERPAPGGGGDEFYQQVADQYLLHAALSRRPAADLAEASGVPVGTVHRWVREARRRGLLPSGRQGKVG